MGPRTLVIGVTGQDGSLMARALLREGKSVFGSFRRGGAEKTWRLDAMGIRDQVDLVELELTDLPSLIEALSTTKPQEVYHLAAHNFVADSLRHPNVTMEINLTGTLNLLTAVRLAAPEARVFIASSSEAVGVAPQEDVMISETSHCAPRNPYGVSKLAIWHMARIYREAHGLRACAGILFNHESPWRDRSFVTRKITYNLARIAATGGGPMELGDLDAARDWGDAEEYVDAMRAMTRLEDQEDMIIATGRSTTVRAFLASAAEGIGLNPTFEGTGVDEVCIDAKSGLVLARVSPKYFRPNGTGALRGDASRLLATTGWSPSRRAEDVACNMAVIDLNRWRTGDMYV